jgi:hypothetical protein
MNDLYREFWKAQAVYMRYRSPKKFSNTDPAKRSQFEAKSLFWNILHVSHCGSIFYRYATPPSPRNPHEINILAPSAEKKVWAKIPTSLHSQPPLDFAWGSHSLSEELLTS